MATVGRKNSLALPKEPGLGKSRQRPQPVRETEEREARKADKQDQTKCGREQATGFISHKENAFKNV